MNKHVLFYTKLFKNSIGGYITSAQLWMHCLGMISELTVITDQGQINNNIPAEYASINDLTKNQINMRKYDVLFYHATNENTYYHRKLLPFCKKIWTYEHDVKTPLSTELLDRIKCSDKVFVPSEILYQKLFCELKNSQEYQEKVSVLPIPIDFELYPFNSVEYSCPLRFSTCCTIKPVRKLESSISFIEKISELCECRLDIFGDTPFGGDSEYKSNLISYVSNRNLPVYFHDKYYFGNEMPKLYRDSHFYIDFSECETYGLAKIEAIISGKRLIMLNVDNNVNLVPSDYPIFRDIESAAKAISASVIEKSLESFDVVSARKYVISHYGVDNVSERVWGFLNNDL